VAGISNGDQAMKKLADVADKLEQSAVEIVVEDHTSLDAGRHSPGFQSDREDPIDPAVRSDLAGYDGTVLEGLAPASVPHDAGRLARQSRDGGVLDGGSCRYSGQQSAPKGTAKVDWSRGNSGTGHGR
jgi:hypothetical protein